MPTRAEFGTDKAAHIRLQILREHSSAKGRRKLPIVPNLNRTYDLRGAGRQRTKASRPILPGLFATFLAFAAVLSEHRKANTTGHLRRNGFTVRAAFFRKSLAATTRRNAAG